jgi:hypothetical protein
MGIRFTCPNGHKLNVKEHLAGKRGVCPNCGAKFLIPATSESNGGAPAVAPAAVGTVTAGFPIPPAGTESTSASAPSVVISVVDSSIPAAPPTVPTSPPPTPTGGPPSFDFTAIPAAPSAPSTVSNYAIRRARSRRLQMQIAVVLLLAVIVLAIVLVWVLERGPAEVPNTTTHLAPATTTAYVAEVERFELWEASLTQMVRFEMWEASLTPMVRRVTIGRGMSAFNRGQRPLP